MNLLVAPDLPDTVRAEIASLIRRFGETVTPFGYYPNDENTGPRCPRCNTLLHNHWWQQVDGDDVLNCGRPS